MMCNHIRGVFSDEPGRTAAGRGPRAGARARPAGLRAEGRLARAAAAAARPLEVSANIHRGESSHRIEYVTTRGFFSLRCTEYLRLLQFNGRTGPHGGCGGERGLAAPPPRGTVLPVPTQTMRLTEKRQKPAPRRGRDRGPATVPAWPSVAAPGVDRASFRTKMIPDVLIFISRAAVYGLFTSLAL